MINHHLIFRPTTFVYSDTPVISQLAADGMVRCRTTWVPGQEAYARRSHMIMSGRTLWHIPNQRMPNPTSQTLNSYRRTLLCTRCHRHRRVRPRDLQNGNSYEEAKALQYVMMAPDVEQVMRKAARVCRTGLEYLQSREDSKDPTHF